MHIQVIFVFFSLSFCSFENFQQKTWGLLKHPKIQFFSVKIATLKKNNCQNLWNKAKVELRRKIKTTCISKELIKINGINI